MLRLKTITSALLLIYLCTGLTTELQAQNNKEDSLFIKKIYNRALEQQIAYKWLYYLSETIGHRIAGSPQNMAAIEFTHQILDTIGCSKVWKQACDVNYWYRGAPEEVAVINHPLVGSQKIKALALGNSAATPDVGFTGDVIEVRSIEEVKKLGFALKDKIVFYNRAFHDADFHTFTSYSSCVDQRVFGPNAVSKFGAKACLVRSMTGRRDDVPHVGTSIFDADVKAIPALAISAWDADRLSKWITAEPTRIFIKTNCEQRGIKQSFSVIGEIKGSEKPEEIILVGGHIDSWDVGGGAHDDGAGCVHSMEVLYLLNKLGYQPKRTIRCVLFQNEENGLAGALKYAKESNENKEFHLAAIESDAGGFTPHGFSYDADTSVLVKYEKALSKWKDLLLKFEIKIQRGGSGADVGQLKSQKGLLFGLRPDSQRYFDYHHTEADVIGVVHPRELALGSAAMASLVYLLDKYGLSD